MRPSRSQQINRALALLDRVIALIEENDEAPVSPIEKASLIPDEVSEAIRCRSPYWKDRQVRAAMLSLYGRCSINDAAAILKAEFGESRAPSRSILARLFAMIAQAKQGA